MVVSLEGILRELTEIEVDHKPVQTPVQVVIKDGTSGGDLVYDEHGNLVRTPVTDLKGKKMTAVSINGQALT